MLNPKKLIETDKANISSNHLSQAVRFTASEWVICSGQLPIHPETKEIPQGAAAQTKQVMDNLKAVLEHARLSFEDVVKTTIFITNLENSKSVNEVYKSYFKGVPPARSQVEVSGLAKNSLVEIECFAVNSSDD